MRPALLLALGLFVACGPAPEPVESGRVASPGPSGAEKARVLAFWKTYEEATDLRLAGRLAEAASAYERALELEPRHEDALYYLGHCSRELGEFQAARDAYARLIEVNPHSSRGHLALGAH